MNFVRAHCSRNRRPPWRATSTRCSISLCALSIAVGGLVTVVIIAFVIRYRQRPDDAKGIRRVGVSHDDMRKIEYLWIGVPLVVFMVIFYWGARLYASMRAAPADSMQVFVVGKQWMWKTQHLSGRREINQLHIPLGRSVKLTMTSEDVIHSFFVPAFRVKADVLPGRYTTMWFEATRVGEYHLFCTEYCGTKHSEMIGKIVVMEPKDFQNWLTQGASAHSANRVRSCSPSSAVRPAIARTRRAGDRRCAVCSAAKFACSAASRSTPTRPTCASRSWRRKQRSWRVTSR